MAEIFNYGAFLEISSFCWLLDCLTSQVKNNEFENMFRKVFLT